MSADTKQSLRQMERVVSSLREQILQGDFGEDGLLPSQAVIADQLGVSRSVVREGMRFLESQGLLHASQGRKHRVIPVNSSSVVDSVRLLLLRGSLSMGQLLEVRRPLESEVASLAARRATPKDLDALAQTLIDLRDATDLDQQIRADRLFHDILAATSGNSIFGMLLEALSELLDESRRRSISNVGTGPALKGHRAILEALSRGNAEGARTAMLAHIDEASRDLWLSHPAQKVLDQGIAAQEDMAESVLNPSVS